MEFNLGKVLGKRSIHSRRHIFDIFLDARWRPLQLHVLLFALSTTRSFTVCCCEELRNTRGKNKRICLISESWKERSHNVAANFNAEALEEISKKVYLQYIIRMKILIISSYSELLDQYPRRLSASKMLQPAGTYKTPDADPLLGCASVGSPPPPLSGMPCHRPCNP